MQSHALPPAAHLRSAFPPNRTATYKRLERPPPKRVSYITTVSKSINTKPSDKKAHERNNPGDERDAGRTDPEHYQEVDPPDSDEMLEVALADIMAVSRSNFSVRTTTDCLCRFLKILLAKSRARSEAQLQLFEDSLTTVNTKAHQLLSNIHEQT